MKIHILKPGADLGFSRGGGGGGGADFQKNFEIFVDLLFSAPQAKF